MDLAGDDIAAVRWWLMRCRVQEEFQARDYLLGLGYACLAPREIYYQKPSRYVRGKGQRIEREKAALPGYLVVGMGGGGPTWSRFMAERERIGYAKHGIRGLVVNGDPVRVRASDVEALIALEDALLPPDYHRRQHRQREYDAGDRVENLDGLWAGAFATVILIREDGRVRVRLDRPLLGIDEVEVEAEALVKAG